MQRRIVRNVGRCFQYSITTLWVFSIHSVGKDPHIYDRKSQISLGLNLFNPKSVSIDIRATGLRESKTGNCMTIACEEEKKTGNYFVHAGTEK